MSATTEHLLMKAHNEILSHAIEWIAPKPAAAADISTMNPKSTQKPTPVERRAAAIIFDEINDSMPGFSLDRFFGELREKIAEEYERAKKKPHAYTPQEREYWDELQHEASHLGPFVSMPAPCGRCEGHGCYECSYTGQIEFRAAAAARIEPATRREEGE